jgi:hypothetical protein
VLYVTCDIPLVTSFPSPPDLCKVLLSCFHDKVVESMVSSISCLLKLSNVLDSYLSTLLLSLQNLLQLTNSKLSFSLSFFHHTTIITKPLHNYNIIALKSPIIAFVHIFTVHFFCFCVFCFCFSLSFFSFFLS